MFASGTLVAAAVIIGGTSPWAKGQVPLLTGPDLEYHSVSGVPASLVIVALGVLMASEALRALNDHRPIRGLFAVAVCPVIVILGVVVYNTAEASANRWAHSQGIVNHDGFNLGGTQTGNAFGLVVVGVVIALFTAFVRWRATAQPRVSRP